MNKLKNKHDYIDNSTIVDLIVFTILFFVVIITLFLLRNF